MASPSSFSEFERAGWEDETTANAYDRHLSAVTRQSIEPLLDDARVTAGHAVLDVATGAGYVAAMAAHRGAKAVGVDFSGTQVDMARRTYPDVAFRQADAQALPFDASSFDAVVNAFGLCHFPDPGLALKEAFRVLKPGGRIAFSVWDAPERAIGFGAVYVAVRDHGSLDVGLPVGPNFFLFSSKENSVQALLDAGFEQPAFRQVPQVWRIAEPGMLHDLVSTSTVRAAATLRAQSEDARLAIKAAVSKSIAQYRRGEFFDVPMPAVIASAVRPRGS